MGEAENGTGGDAPVDLWELRRSYHDRIADCRARSQRILALSVADVGLAVTALVDCDPGPLPRLLADDAEASAINTSIDRDALDLLALESPVARDLRVILATRDVARIGLLCSGLCLALAGRAGGAGPSIVDPIPRLLHEVAGATVAALDAAAQSWAGLDPHMEARVAELVEAARLDQTHLVAALLDLREVPMEAALDLALASRAFDRLIDHAEEIGERVCFAAGGQPNRPVT